jgi:hypothetical protein
MNELTITKEKVLAAASKCGSAQEVLMSMFPEAFEGKTKEIKPFEVNTSDTNNLLCIAYGYAEPEFVKRCFGLNPKYKWEIKDGRQGWKVLIPTEK